MQAPKKHEEEHVRARSCNHEGIHMHQLGIRSESAIAILLNPLGGPFRNCYFNEVSGRSAFATAILNYMPRTFLSDSHNFVADGTCFKGSRTSCDVVNFGFFGPNFWPGKITSRDGCSLLTLHFPETVAATMFPTGCRPARFHVSQVVL